MALFKLTEDRYLDTDAIADIQYTPQVFTPNPAAGIEEGLIQNCSFLAIELKTGEKIRLEAEQADMVWQSFQPAQTPAKRQETEIPAAR